MGTRKNIKSKKSNKRFRKTRTKKQKGGDAELDKKLLAAAKNKDLNKVIAALTNGADVNAKNENGTTSLYWASRKGHTEIVTMLLEKRAIVDAKDNGGYTALYWASYYGYTDIVKLLLEKGASVNELGNNGKTALDMASEQGHTEIVKLLKKAIETKEENFIVDKFCKEANYLDVIDGEITRDIQEYLQEDKDNIMLIYKSNKADTDLEYFGTTRPIITNAFKDKINLFFGCTNDKSRFGETDDDKNFNKKITYFKLSKIGLVGTSSEYCDIKTLLENEEHQLFAIKSLTTRYPSFVSHHVLYSGSMGQAMISGSHCQGGDAASVSTLIKAYPKNDKFPEISDSNMLQETAVESLSLSPEQDPRLAFLQTGGAIRKTKTKIRKTRKKKSV
jgi:hypothetical protein